MHSLKHSSEMVATLDLQHSKLSERLFEADRVLTAQSQVRIGLLEAETQRVQQLASRIDTIALQLQNLQNSVWRPSRFWLNRATVVLTRILRQYQILVILFIDAVDLTSLRTSFAPLLTFVILCISMLKRVYRSCRRGRIR
ncbi:hypothetical protein BCV70DRAFT_111831 [Testicularia cyperi]|uniref:Uncharacterized protein n=1 Tax=Testicularia cyperi TaxID=1882483 RepID=A0A317XPA7_9BASI|nr:hypothetical protein BCV70DRAFT_111831 [Testicularia cyperi]